VRKTAVERLRDARRKKPQKVQLTFDGLLLLLLDGDRAPEDRQILPTQRKFIYDYGRVKAYKGPAGCAKTSTICAAGLMRALFQPGSKGLVARYDYNDLMDTTKLRMEDMLARLPEGTLLQRDKSPPEKWWIQPVLGSGDPDEVSEITFMGLKDPKGSYEFDWAIIDEADECEGEQVRLVNSRLRNRVNGKDLPYSVMLAFNPPDVTHWLYTACTGLDHRNRPVRDGKWMQLYEPVPDENVRNLPANYYEELTKTLLPDQAARLVKGEWGGTFPGQPVYREYNVNLHAVRELHKRYDPMSPLFRFWDFGYNHPAVIFAQLDDRGRLQCLRELVAEKIEIQPLAERVKSFSAEHFPYQRDFRDYGDPAARQKKDTGSTLVELGKAGITLMYKIVPTVDEGIRAVRTCLTRLVDGEPMLMVDPHECPVLHAALRGGYHLDEKTGTKPVKDDFYDHIADALRYGVTNVMQGNSFDIRDWPASIASRG
jgi:hypothetical protein